MSNFLMTKTQLQRCYPISLSMGQLAYHPMNHLQDILTCILHLNNQSQYQSPYLQKNSALPSYYLSFAKNLVTLVMSLNILIQSSCQALWKYPAHIPMSKRKRSERDSEMLLLRVLVSSTILPANTQRIPESRTKCPHQQPSIHIYLNLLLYLHHPYPHQLQHSYPISRLSPPTSPPSVHESHSQVHSPNSVPHPPS